MSEMAAHIRHAVALRYLAAARSQTVNHAVPETAALPEFGELHSAYRKVVDDWLGESPSDAHDVLALVEFAIATVTRQGCDCEGNSIIGAERDRFDASVALASIRQWVNQIDIKELGNEIIARRAIRGADAIMRARSGADA